MLIHDIIQALEQLAPPSLQESYDNSGLLTGNGAWECTGVLVSLDTTEEIILEARNKGCNLVVAHHPIIFGGIKKLNGKNYVERTVISAIRHDIAIYAIHTNLDNIREGVSGYMASRLGLVNQRVLEPKKATLRKLVVYAPQSHADAVRDALFASGAGEIGKYSHCSFNTAGTGTYLAGEDATPFLGSRGKLHREPEQRMEVVVPASALATVITAMKQAHPYEEVAYDVLTLENEQDNIGSGIIGELADPLRPEEFLGRLKVEFGTGAIRHTELPEKRITVVALCGGAGSFLISKALRSGADAFVTADLKYHEFFDAEGRMLLADIGHYESEQFTIELLHAFLLKKFPNFAVLKTGLNTNPVLYF